MRHEHTALAGAGKWSNHPPSCWARTFHGQILASSTHLRLRATLNCLCTSGSEERAFSNFGNGSGISSSNRNRILATEAATLLQQEQAGSLERQERFQLKPCSGNCGGDQFTNTGSTDPQNNQPTISAGPRFQLSRRICRESRSSTWPATSTAIYLPTRMTQTR